MSESSKYRTTSSNPSFAVRGGIITGPNGCGPVFVFEPHPPLPIVAACGNDIGVSDWGGHKEELVIGAKYATTFSGFTPFVMKSMPKPVVYR